MRRFSYFHPPFSAVSYNLLSISAVNLRLNFNYKVKFMAKAGKSAKTTTNHDEVREFIEFLNGKPAAVRGTSDASGQAVLQIDLMNDNSLDHLGWDEFFQLFDKNNLALRYVEPNNDGKIPQMFEFVQRGTDNAAGTLKKTRPVEQLKTRHIDDDSPSISHDEDAKKKATKGTTARKDNDDDSKDKNPDTKGGAKTKSVEFKRAGKPGENEGSDQESNWDEPRASKGKLDPNDHKKSGKENPKKKTSEQKSKS
jgi:hypothetical protein